LKTPRVKKAAVVFSVCAKKLLFAKHEQNKRMEFSKRKNGAPGKGGRYNALSLIVSKSMLQLFAFIINSTTM